MKRDATSGRRSAQTFSGAGAAFPEVAPRESAIIIAVPEAEATVASIRRHLDPASVAGAPAHITLLYPFAPPEQIDEQMLRNLGALFARETAFAFALTATGRFPGVLYLTPEPTAPFLHLVGKLRDRYPAFRPYRGAHPTVIPHLTLAISENTELLRAVGGEVLGKLPIRAVARQALLFINSDGHWQARAAFPFREQPATTPS